MLPSVQMKFMTLKTRIFLQPDTRLIENCLYNTQIELYHFRSDITAIQKHFIDFKISRIE